MRICQNPVLRGKGEALKKERIREIVNQYRGMIDVFVLCVDRDGPPGHARALSGMEASQRGGHAHFLAQEAWEEIETWALAGLKLPSKWRWQEVRQEIQVKEVFFDQLVKQRGLADSPGKGRKRLGEEAARKIATIRAKCPEDFDALALRLETL